jgi:hypothetical protein
MRSIDPHASALAGLEVFRPLGSPLHSSDRGGRYAFRTNELSVGSRLDGQSPVAGKSPLSQVTRDLSRTGPRVVPEDGQFGRKVEQLFARCLADQLLAGSSLSAGQKAVGLNNWNHLIAETLTTAISASGSLKLADRFDAYRGSIVESRD